MRTLNIARTVALVMFLWTVFCLLMLNPPEPQDYIQQLTPLRFRGEHSASYPRPLADTYCHSWDRPGEPNVWTDRPSAYAVKKIEDFGWTRVNSASEARVVSYRNNYNPSLTDARITTKRKPSDLENAEGLFFAPKEAAMLFTRMYFYGDENFLNFQAAVLGVDYACPGQILNHVPGASAFCRKDLIQHYMRDYQKRYKAKGLDHCYTRSITPKSYILSETDHCQQFLNELETALTKYSEDSMPIEWITKNARRHKGYGIDLIDYKAAQHFLSLYSQSGGSCERPLESHKHLIAQQYINNPATIDGRKFDFRIFAMIANVDPFIVLWAPENGHTRVSDTVFNKTSSDFTTHITANVAGTNEGALEYLKERRFNLRELARFFAAELGDPDKWLDEVAFPQVKSILIHMFRASQQNLLVKRTGLMEFYGVDFMLDEKLENFYLLEANRRPDVQEKNPDLQYREDQLIQDFAFIAEHLVETGVTTFNPDEFYPYLQAFKPLIDETKKDPYFGVLPEECRVPFKEFNPEMETDPMIDSLLLYLKEFN
mmetsp:Transcript_26250/g.46933  ORF Transcript_26250/g.46933 Transcript_26250/m.46933 type:complete len:543 (+) Transcript_26250:2383-4011(+)